MKERGVGLSGHVSRWIGGLDLDQYRWIVCVGRDEAGKVRSALGGGPTRVLVANDDHGGIPDPYDLGLEGYRDCLALPDRFFDDDHYRGYPAVLVRLDVVEADELAGLLRGAWRVTALKALLKQHVDT